MLLQSQQLFTELYQQLQFTRWTVNVQLNMNDWMSYQTSQLISYILAF